MYVFRVIPMKPMHAGTILIVYIYVWGVGYTNSCSLRPEDGVEHEL